MEFRGKEAKRERRLRRTGARIATGGITMFGRGDVHLSTGPEKPTATDLPPEYRQDLINAIRNEPYTKSLMGMQANGEEIRISVHAAVDRALNEMQVPRGEQPYLPAQAGEIAVEAGRN